MDPSKNSDQQTQTKDSNAEKWTYPVTLLATPLYPNPTSFRHCAGLRPQPIIPRHRQAARMMLLPDRPILQQAHRRPQHALVRVAHVSRSHDDQIPAPLDGRRAGARVAELELDLRGSAAVQTAVLAGVLAVGMSRQVADGHIVAFRAGGRDGARTDQLVQADDAVVPGRWIGLAEALLVLLLIELVEQFWAHDAVVCAAVLGEGRVASRRGKGVELGDLIGVENLVDTGKSGELARQRFTIQKGWLIMLRGEWF